MMGEVVLSLPRAFKVAFHKLNVGTRIVFTVLIGIGLPQSCLRLGLR
jgi:hypothetical protein